MNITVISYLFIFCILITGCTGNIVKKNGCIDISDTTIVNNAESKLIGLYRLGTTIGMRIVQGDYTSESKEIFAIVLNPESLRLSYGRDWTLEKWENGQWIRPKTKVNILFFDDEIILPESDFLCFSFPIEYYKITPSRYRISKSFWNDREEIKLSAEFEIK